MAIYRCPSCQIPLTDTEWNLGTCSGCDQPLPAGPDPVRAPAPVATGSGPVADARVPWITWTLLVSGFLLLGGLILGWRPGSDSLDAPLTMHADPVDKAMQRLEEQLGALRLANTDAKTTLTTLVARLEGLDAKIAEQTAAATRQADDAKSVREQMARLETQLRALTQRSFAPPPPPGPLDIRAHAEGWHDAVPENIQAV